MSKSSNSVLTQTLIGIVTDVTGEKRGPSKHYRKFNLITTNNETVSGWVFADILIEDTYAGQQLLKAQNSKKSVRLNGKIENDQGGSHGNERALMIIIDI